MRGKNLMDITHRNIAVMLAKGLPIDGEEFGHRVNEYTEVIKRLPQNAKVALKSALIFSHKAPHQERDDLFQELALAVLKSRTKDEKLAYAIARCDWLNWWKKYKIRQHYSLDTVIENEDGTPKPLTELIIGEVDWERRIDGKVDAERIWDKLPDHIKPIVLKRLISQPLTKQEHNTLSYWVKSKGYQLLLA